MRAAGVRSRVICRALRLATSVALGVMLSVSRHAARTDDTDTEAATRELQSLPENLRTDNPTQL